MERLGQWGDWGNDRAKLVKVVDDDADEEVGDEEGAWLGLGLGLGLGIGLGLGLGLGLGFGIGSGSRNDAPRRLGLGVGVRLTPSPALTRLPIRPRAHRGRPRVARYHPSRRAPP